MNNYTLKLEEYAKLNALKYFSSLFDKDLMLSERADEKKLKDLYNNYCHDYFVRYDYNSTYERAQIRNGYDYINMLMNNYGVIHPENDYTKKIYDSYKNLTLLISKYQFVSSSEKSHSHSQNKTNKNLLMDISLLVPILIKTINDLDIYFNNVSNIINDREFFDKIIRKINILVNKLEVSFDILSEFMNIYHNIWLYTNAGSNNDRYTKSDLGIAKNNWKKAKNMACHEILDFYHELLVIDNALMTKSFDNINLLNKDNRINELYQFGIKKIKNGNNYYSYLTNEEKDEMIKENKLKKIKK